MHILPLQHAISTSAPVRTLPTDCSSELNSEREMIPEEHIEPLEQSTFAQTEEFRRNSTSPCRNV